MARRDDLSKCELHHLVGMVLSWVKLGKEKATWAPIWVSSIVFPQRWTQPPTTSCFPQQDKMPLLTRSHIIPTSVTSCHVWSQPREKELMPAPLEVQALCQEPQLHSVCPVLPRCCGTNRSNRKQLGKQRVCSSLQLPDHTLPWGTLTQELK